MGDTHIPPPPRIGSNRTYELLRFIFLSVIAVTPIAAFGLTDVQIAPLSPIGIVTKSGNVTGTQDMFNNQWVINIGGLATDNYNSGIQVPVSIFIFGIMGGYLRFLYYTSRKERKDEVLSEPFFESLKDLSIMFLSPLLAIALWLVLFQGGTTSPFTLAAISFTIGLITREVVESLVTFVSKTLGTQESKATATTAKKATSGKQ